MGTPLSYAAIQWALSQSVPKSSAKFVLVAMADRVNADGSEMTCWPSNLDLSRRTGQDTKTVEAGLRRLREHGFIEDTGERRGNTGQVIVYRLKNPEFGGVGFGQTGQANDGREDLNTPKSGAVDETSKTPEFPPNTPVFPVKHPQISHQTPPKTGDGTSNGTSKGTNKELRKKVPLVVVELPGVPVQLLADYLAVRKAKKAGPLTETAVAGLLREGQKAGMTLVEVITLCCERSWQGFNAGWVTGIPPAAGRGRAPASPTKYAAAAHTIFGDTPEQGVIDV